MQQKQTSKPSVFAQPAQPQLEPHEAELKRKKELLAKLQVMDRSAAINRWRFNESLADPTKEYKAVNINQARVMEYLSMEYQICKTPGLTGFQQEDGSHRRGDLVLMEVDKEAYELRSYRNAVQGLEEIEAVKEKFSEAAIAAGAIPYGMS